MSLEFPVAKKRLFADIRAYWVHKVSFGFRQKVSLLLLYLFS